VSSPPVGDDPIDAFVLSSKAMAGAESTKHTQAQVLSCKSQLSDLMLLILPHFLVGWLWLGELL